MTLADQLRPLLPARARGRGRGAGEVEFVVIEDSAQDGVHATVHGRESHEVTLRVEPPAEWSACCTCPVFRRTGACRHVWAVVLEADERGLALAGAADDAADPTYTALDPASELWRTRLSGVRESLAEAAPDPWDGLVPRRAAAGFELSYVVDLDDTKSGRGLVLRPFWRGRQRNARWGRRRAYDPEDHEAPHPTDPLDQKVFRALRAARRSAWTASANLSAFGGSGAYWLDDAECDLMLPLLADSGRAFLHHHGAEEVEPLAFDPGEPWMFGATLTRDERSRRARIDGFLARRGERMTLVEPHLVLHAGYLFLDHRVAKCDTRGAWALLDSMRTNGAIEGPLEDADELAERLIDLPGHPLLEGEGLHLADPVVPEPRLEIDAAPESGDPHLCRLRFSYGSLSVDLADPRGALRDAKEGRVVRRSWSAEREALRTFVAAGGEPSPGTTADGHVEADFVEDLVLDLSEAGWAVAVNGSACRPAEGVRLEVKSGVDWFDLEGGLVFGDQIAPLSDLLAALDSGHRSLQLADGTLGILPDAIRREWALFAGIGRRVGEGLRFQSTQGFLLDRLLHEREGVQLDARFAELRAGLAAFEGIEQEREPEGFQGDLRSYQRDGLGWFSFLRTVGFGGCLADDMGLGKTVQVLALLERRRIEAPEAGPTLVVVPKSLIFNWRSEAKRFAPELKVLDYTGPGRDQEFPTLRDSHLVLTTYGTLRRDIFQLKDVDFDYVVLDEAQAIKNASSHSAKAARLLSANCRLALSGTPIENHLGELWSLFEFLNPGMLGRARAFRSLVGSRGELALDGQGRSLLAAALRPFFLRRTKEQVLPDLPPKIEQVLWCELDEAARAEYDVLRQHYRASFSQGSNKREAFQVLRALLRLRQAACHPGLADPDRADESSAKLEVLLPHLLELVASGNKALVFSQFTTHLAVVRQNLDREGIPYAYLDGKTRDRESVVQRFREDPDCPLFLMSLKAGGLGLNLVEADYVFLLDPWWNPAAETQAIDRAHRIGRTRAVVAYRLIARGTIEEKVLELQAKKRDLADAVLKTEDGWLKTLSIDDLELLFT